MTWYEQIIAVHTAVTTAVSHWERMQSDRYFVWQEDPSGGSDFVAGNVHAEQVVTGTTDLYTKQEFDPWADAFEASLNGVDTIAWYKNTADFDEETGFYHHEWVWQIPKGGSNG